MPVGCFIVEIDPKSKPVIKAMHYSEEEEKKKINDNIILKLRLGHSETKLYTYLSPELSIVSYLTEFKRGKNPFQMILGVILKSSDNPTNFREQVKIASDEILPMLKDNDGALSKKLDALYDEYFETPTVLLNQKELEARLKDRIKKLNKAGKFDEAKKMLDLMKKIPNKLFKSNKKAEKAIQHNDLDSAEKELKKAIKYAEELGEKEQASVLKEKAKLVKQIPKLQEKRKKELKQARDYLRKEKFNSAYKHFKSAADLSKKLMDTDAAEEYGLKADALAKFAEVHKRFH
ncbi:MAG: hypothetical protein GF364_02600 [Candidatus Lokiarchaeota archaeon]|nr:hypothetical protein [Candidatus Lokiarchaeota archaeon]